MTTISEIVTAGFREGNIIAIGDEPTEEEATEAISILNNYIRSMFGHDIPIRYTDWPVPFPLATAELLARYPQLPVAKDTIDPNPDVYLYPPCGSRILVSSLGESRTLYLPYNPYDGARMSYVDVGQDYTLTIDGNGRYVEGAKSIDIEPSSESSGRNSVREWFYRADLAEWIQVKKDYEAEDESPLPPDFDDLLSTSLAIRLGGRFRKNVEDATVARNSDMMQKLRQRYRHRPNEIGQASELTRGVQFPDEAGPGRLWE